MEAGERASSVLCSSRSTVAVQTRKMMVEEVEHLSGEGRRTLASGLRLLSWGLPEQSPVDVS